VCPSAQQGDIGDAEEQATQLVQQRQAVGPHSRVIGVDENRFEEGIHRLTQTGQLGQGLAVAARGGHGRYGLGRSGHGLRQSLLSTSFQQAAVQRGRQLTFGLRQDVRHTLVGGGQGSGLRQLAERLHGLNALMKSSGAAGLSARTAWYTATSTPSSS